MAGMNVDRPGVVRNSADAAQEPTTSRWRAATPQGSLDGPRSFGRVAACVLTYNRKETLLRCLDALMSQTRPVDLILVFDNGSADGTSEALAAAGYRDDPRLEFIRVDANRGPAGGFCATMRAGYRSGCEWLWVMDDDVLPAPTALEELVAAYHACCNTPEDLGFLVSRVVTADGKPNNVPDIDNRQSETEQPRWAEQLQHGMVRVAWSTLNSTLFPRSSLREFGVTSPDFFYGGDDIDLTIRIARARPSFIVGRSLAVHLRASSGTFHPLNEANPARTSLYFYYYRSQIYLRRAHMSRKALCLFTIGAARDVVQVLLRSPNRFAMARTILAGIAAGFVFRPRRAAADDTAGIPASC